jgi:ADP-ribosylglycohydrolase
VFVRAIMLGLDAPAAWDEARSWANRFYAKRWPVEYEHFQRIVERSAADWAKVSRKDVSGSGYVVHTLEASLWCLFTTESFSECVLAAVNLGEDTDTTGAVAGGGPSRPETQRNVRARGLRRRGG